MNVLERLSSNFGIELGFSTVTMDTGSPLVDELLNPATSGDRAGADPD